ncbi:Flp pilus assembly protein TadG [Nocardioides scoriae]|uniref:Flp pilus assembly protein TadG n=1 Tax=Nocardioides scoriae TaxID=642780 RepID=A0A1H1YGN0_9ACTN|nr:Flp pilus assembly protein TadG [Nocardioides scoriae]
MLSRNRARDEEGAVAVLAGILFSTLFLMAALVVQFGFTRDVRQDSQNAADASALAAALTISTSNASTPDLSAAVAVAISYAQKNTGVAPGTWTACTDPAKLAVVTATTGCVSFDSSTAPTKVRVLIPVRETKTAIGAGAGVRTLGVNAAAEASIAIGQTLKCAMCFLGPVDSGNADYTVSGGSIAVNGDVTMGPNGNLKAIGGAIGVAGTASGGTYTPAATTIRSFTDPWAARTDLPPSTTGLTARTNPCSTGTAGGPGIYGDFAFPKSTCTLQPGLYVVRGAWTESNKSVLAGTGVTLYFTCSTGSTPRPCNSPGELGGYLDAKNGEVAFSAPTSGPLQGVALLYDRSNTRDVGLQGNGGTNITGALYAPRSKLDFNGNSCFGFSGGPIIVDGVIKANGNKSCVEVANPVDATYAVLPGETSLSR